MTTELGKYAISIKVQRFRLVKNKTLTCSNTAELMLFQESSFATKQKRARLTLNAGAAFLGSFDEIVQL